MDLYKYKVGDSTANSLVKVSTFKISTLRRCLKTWASMLSCIIGIVWGLCCKNGTEIQLFENILYHIFSRHFSIY